MIKRLLISILVGIFSTFVTLFSFGLGFLISVTTPRSLNWLTFPIGRFIVEVINWSLPFWQEMYPDMMHCTGLTKESVTGTALTNGILLAVVTYLILWLRARNAKLKLQ